VKFVIETRQNKITANEKLAAAKSQDKIIDNIIANKEMESLGALSVEDLKKLKSTK